MKKDALLKLITILAAVVLFFAVVSKLLLHNSMTLAEYAAQNNTVAEAGKDTGTAGTTPPSSVEPPASTETVPESVVSSKTAHSWEDEADIPISPDRVTYQEGFFYEPLSDSLIDSITGVSYPAEGTDEISYEELNYLHVLHYDFEGNIVEGELICNSAISQDLAEIFHELYLAEYSIEKITLIDAYDGDDEASMTDNNTSCFNYRNVEGADKLSRHAYGLALDINPFYNPYVRYDKEGRPYADPEDSAEYMDRSRDFPYKIDQNDLCYRLFTERGFTWGGNWNSSKDYQHFQKIPTGGSPK